MWSAGIHPSFKIALQGCDRDWRIGGLEDWRIGVGVDLKLGRETLSLAFPSSGMRQVFRWRQAFRWRPAFTKALTASATI